MPRIPTSYILRAYQQDPLLPLLLQECRTLDSAQNELRWLREWAVQKFYQRTSRFGAGTHRSTPGWRSHLRSMCRERARGVPLQYLLGDQPFGDLEIICKKGVLIPRFETESYVLQTAKWILNDLRHHSQSITNSGSRPRSLHILDLCSGTGCISLLLHALLAPHFEHLSIMGIDLSPIAIKLAVKNLTHNLTLGLLHSRAIADVQFRQGDVLARSDINTPSVEDLLCSDSARLLYGHSGHASTDDHKWDVIISNPPYVSPLSFRDGTTSRSVRTYEPEIALVPPSVVDSCYPDQDIGTLLREDTFYPHLLSLSCKLRVRLTVLECGDLQQAQRVAMLAESLASEHYGHGNFTVKLWDWDDSNLGNKASNTLNGTRAVVLTIV